MFRVDWHMTSPFMGGEGLMQKWDVIGLGEVGGYRVFWTSSLYFLLKKIGFVLWPDVMLSQTFMSYHNSEGGFNPPSFWGTHPLTQLATSPFLNLCFPPLCSVLPPFKLFQTVPPTYTQPSPALIGLINLPFT